MENLIYTDTLTLQVHAPASNCHVGNHKCHVGASNNGSYTSAIDSQACCSDKMSFYLKLSGI